MQKSLCISLAAEYGPLALEDECPCLVIDPEYEILISLSMDVAVINDTVVHIYCTTIFYWSIRAARYCHHWSEQRLSFRVYMRD